MRLRTDRLPPWLLWLSLPVLAGIWLLFSSRSLEPRTAPAADDTSPPRYSLRGIHWVRLDASGQREFTADADSGDYFDDQSARYEQLRMNVPQIGDTPWRLTSPTGSQGPRDPRVLMQGPVDVTGSWPDDEALAMQTPQLWVDPQTHQIQTDAGVVFTGETRNGQAQGMLADWNRKTVNLHGDVRMHYAVRAH